jgi:hypothetical protein
MARTWNDQMSERAFIGTAMPPCDDTVMCFPDPPERANHDYGVIQFILAVLIFGTVIPPDLYFANWLLGRRIHALGDPMVINSLVTLSAVLAVPVIPLMLLALLVHRRQAARGERNLSIGGGGLSSVEPGAG